MPKQRQRSWSAPCHGLLALLITALALAAAQLLADTADPLQAQRKLYVEATQALSRGERQRFVALRQRLLDYPLLPYLDYGDLSKRLYRVETQELDHYLNTHGASPPGRRLRLQWLTHLATSQRWASFLHYYDASLVSEELDCHHALALYLAGDRAQGISAGRALWRVGKSQPKGCDPLFQRLRSDGHIDDELAWQRYLAALLNHNQGLTNYAARFFTRPQTQAKANFFAQVDENPRLLAQRERFTAGSADDSPFLRHTLKHLVELDSQQALALWQHYRQSHPFSLEDEQDINGALIRALYDKGLRGAADDWLRQVGDKVNADLLDWRLRELVKHRDWQTLIDLGSDLEAQLTTDSRWKYWRARALILSGNREPETSQRLLREVSQERSFHGFLAAEWLQIPHQMQHDPLAVSAEEQAALQQTPAFQRSRELYLLRDLTWARREWALHLTGQDAKQWVAAARLAQNWGWHHQAIMTMAQATYWNDIELRFPTPYREHFSRQADITAVPVNLLLALARQESAFNDSALSPAGARGLLQLMPATARETARKHGIAYAGVANLTDPARNIQLGSRYYRQMLSKFNNNRILATAAYNAGPGRVASWRRNSGGTLPFDVWIETIPFKETRNYVQNVLAFSIIYAHHLGLDSPMLSEREKATLL